VSSLPDPHHDGGAIAPSTPDAIAPPPTGSAIRVIARDIRDALRGTSIDYTAGSIGRAILLLAVPMVVEMCMESVFAVVDVFFVGRLGPTAVATVGLVESLMIVVYTLAFGLSIGAGAIVARRVGEQQPDAAARSAVQVLLLGALLATCLSVAGAIRAPQLLALMGADAEVLRDGTTFARVTLAGSATAFLLFLVNAVFRGAGDAAVAMRVLILANGLNCVLDPLLIFGLGPVPAFGLTGAAIATTIGRGVGLLWALRLLGRGGGRLHVRRSHLQIEPGTMWRIASLSGWGTIQVAISSASWIGLVRVTALFGSTAMAGYTIAIRIILFVLMPAFGIAAAASTLVGQSLGASLPERAERAVWTAARVNVAALGAAAVAFWIGAPWMVRLFTVDAGTIAVAVYALRAIGVGFPLYALGMVLEQAFNGAGDTRTPSWLNLGAFWVVQIPLAWGLATQTTLAERGVFLAVPIAYGVLASASAILFRRGAWKQRTV
jgi:putative MATE family efflux protein